MQGIITCVPPGPLITGGAAGEETTEGDGCSAAVSLTTGAGRHRYPTRQAETGDTARDLIWAAHVISLQPPPALRAPVAPAAAPSPV